jgi:hypothetical protein
MGRPPIFEKAMTRTELQQRWRCRHRQKAFHDPCMRRPQPKRGDEDYWPTPECLIQALRASVLPILPAGPIWECAAGDGRLCAALEAAGRRVIGTDVLPRGEGIRTLDFLTGPPPPETQARSSRPIRPTAGSASSLIDARAC